MPFLHLLSYILLGLANPSWATVKIMTVIDSYYSCGQYKQCASCDLECSILATQLLSGPFNVIRSYIPANSHPLGVSLTSVN